MAQEVFRQTEEEIASLASDIRSWQDVDRRIPFVVFSHQREGVSGAATTLPRPSRIQADRNALITGAYWDNTGVRYEVTSTTDHKRHMVCVEGKSTPDFLLRLNLQSAGLQQIEMYEGLVPNFDKPVPEPHIDFGSDAGVNLIYREQGKLDLVGFLFRKNGILSRQSMDISLPPIDDFERSLPRYTEKYLLEDRSQVIFEVRAALRDQVSLHVTETINPGQLASAFRKAELGKFPTTFQPASIRLEIGKALQRALIGGGPPSTAA